jgi:hypothetical protein
MMEFNYLAEQKAVNRTAGKYSVHLARIPTAIASLAKELLTIEATATGSALKPGSIAMTRCRRSWPRR